MMREMLDVMRRGWSPLPGDPSAFFTSVAQSDAASAVVASLAIPPGIYNVAEDEPMRRGEWSRSLAAAAGLGLLDEVRRMLPTADANDRHRALALATQCGHADVVGELIDAGEDPNRFNPPGTHSHSPPLHQAIAAGHLNVARVLVEKGAMLDIKDTIYQGTPLDWAHHCNQPEIAEYLSSKGAS